MPDTAADWRALLVRRAATTFLTVVALGMSPAPARPRIEAMVEEAENLAYLEAFVPARAALESALRAAERLGDSSLAALCLDRIGLAFDFEGEPTAGVDRRHRALALAGVNNDRRMTASILASTGLAHWRRSDYAAAAHALHEALAIQEDIGDDNGRARTLNFIGRVHFKKGEYDRAKEVYQRAVGILARTGQQQWLSITFEGLGDVAVERGFFVEALDAFEQALRARREADDRPGESYMLHIIGRAYLLQAAYREALIWFERALAVAEESGSRPARALALYHMGIAHSGMARHPDALRFYDEALALKEELGDRRQQAWILARAGDALAAMHDRRAALDRYRRASRIWEDIGDPRGLTSGLARAGRIAFDLGQYDESAELFRRASELVGDSQPPFLADALANLGKALAAGGHEASALTQGQRAVAAAEGATDIVRWQASRSLGWINRRLGHRQEALDHYRDSLEIIERLRGRVAASADVRAEFLEDKQAVYADTVDLLVEGGRGGEALEVAERARARGFLDLLSGRDLTVRPPDRAMLAKITALQDELSREAQTKSTASSLPRAEVDRGSRVRRELAMLSTTYPELTSLVTTPSLTLAQSRAEARRTGGTLLSYFSADERLFIWVITPDGAVHAASSRISRRKLLELTVAVRSAMAADTPSRGTVPEYKGADMTRASDSDPRSLLRQLHEALVEPIQDLLPRERDQLVTIIPHGPLFLVSFATLIDGEGRYFVERHTLAYSPSISVLRYTGRNRARVVNAATRPRLLVIGNPVMPRAPHTAAAPNRPDPALPSLPGAEHEAHIISDLFSRHRVMSLVGSQASEDAVRELAPGQSIIHLATHAVAFDDEPMDGYLALAPHQEASAAAPAAPRDGFLSVAEVFGLDLRADLVTLSACNTGLGRVSGEGVVGLSRAFIYAGAASVLVSLWRVADTVTVTQMEQFYRGLIRSGGNKAAALAAAQREMIALLRARKVTSPDGRTLTEDPLLWGAFVLVGEAR
jgi:CHAT domain-containing protein/tetratricopeptide (TPR) repeat protein